MDCGEEGVRVIARSAFAGGWHDGDETGEVFVFRSESVSHPAAYRGANEVGCTGVQEKCRRAVGDALGMHRVDEAKVVDMLADVWEELADPLAGFAVLFEIPEWLEEFALALFSEGGFTDADKVEALTVTFNEIRFVVEAVDMAGTAGHEQEDDALGAGGEKRRLWSEGVRGALRGAGEHGVERQRTETTSGGFEKLTSIRAHHELRLSLI